MGDKYTVGQAGAVGPGAKAKQMSFQQIVAEAHENIDLNTFAEQLALVRGKMREAAVEPEHDIAIGNIAAAESAAKKGDEQGTLQHLKNAGQWALQFARDVGSNVVADVMSKAMGL